MKTNHSVILNKRKSLILVLSLIAFWYFGGVVNTFAHGDEDHGAEKPKAVTNADRTETRSVNVGEYEIFLKTPPLVSDREVSGQVFVTDHDTNAPIANAQIVFIIERGGAKEAEFSATASENQPGAYRAKFPPVPSGEIKITGTIKTANESQKFNLGAMNLAPPQTESVLAETSWARTALFWLGAIVILGVVGAGLWFVARRFKTVQDVHQDEIKQETVSA